jgi:hypothetical protein
MEMTDSMFSMMLEGTEWFVNKETRYLDSFEKDLRERITVFQMKYGAITRDLFLQTLKVRTLLQDSKGDPVINVCNSALHTKGHYQQELLFWTTLAPVFDEFYKAHVVYEQAYGDQKISLRNKKQAMFLTNGDVYKESASGQRKKGMAMVAAAETEKLVAFAKKDEEAGAADCRHCGLPHKGRCTTGERADETRSGDTFIAENHQL